MKKILTILAVLAVTSQAHAAGLTLGGYSVQQQASNDLYYGQQQPVYTQQSSQAYGQANGQQQAPATPESSGTHSSSSDLRQMNF